MEFVIAFLGENNDIMTDPIFVKAVTGQSERTYWKDRVFQTSAGIHQDSDGPSQVPFQRAGVAVDLRRLCGSGTDDNEQMKFTQPLVLLGMCSKAFSVQRWPGTWYLQVLYCHIKGLWDGLLRYYDALVVSEMSGTGIRGWPRGSHQVDANRTPIWISERSAAVSGGRLYFPKVVHSEPRLA